PLPTVKSKPKVLFLYPRGSGGANVSGTGTGADEVIRLAGAENAVTQYEGYRPVTAESLVTAQPDVVLVTVHGLSAMGGEEAIWSLPGMKTTPAGQNKRLIMMNDLRLLGFGPRTAEVVNELRKELSQ
nr:ABC transporter substrate-binding protein [Kiritimatiellia bacterium]